MSEMERADPSDFAAPPPAAPPNSTIDEPVSETILRDVRLVGRRLSLVMLPGVSASARSAALRDWDLWGPLFVCMSLAVLLSVESAGEGSLLFSLIFVIVWAGAAVVTINGQLLGGRLAFFGSVCLLGYCIAPLLVAAAGCVLVNATVSGGVAVVVRFGLVVAGLAWSIWGRLGREGFWWVVRLEQGVASSRRERGAGPRWRGLGGAEAVGVGDVPRPRSACGVLRAIVGCSIRRHGGVPGERMSRRGLGCFGSLTNSPALCRVVLLFVSRVVAPPTRLHCCVPPVTHSLLLIHGRRGLPRRPQASCPLPGVALLPVPGMDGAHWIPAGTVCGCDHHAGAGLPSGHAAARGGSQHHPESAGGSVRAGD